MQVRMFGNYEKWLGPGPRWGPPLILNLPFEILAFVIYLPATWDQSRRVRMWVSVIIRSRWDKNLDRVACWLLTGQPNHNYSHPCIVTTISTITTTTTIECRSHQTSSSSGWRLRRTNKDKNLGNGNMKIALGQSLPPHLISLLSHCIALLLLLLWTKYLSELSPLPAKCGQVCDP